MAIHHGEFGARLFLFSNFFSPKDINKNSYKNSCGVFCLFLVLWHKIKWLRAGLRLFSFEMVGGSTKYIRKSLD